MTPALALRLAGREMRGGLSGFVVFLACLALGVAAIAAVGTLSRGLTDGLMREGRAILGGDIAFSVRHRPADAAELAFLEGLGPVTASATLSAMARRADRADQTIVELKAVDARYPLAGEVVLAPAIGIGPALAMRDGVPGAAVEPAILARLKASVGDRLLIGEAAVEIRAVLDSEPDRLGSGLGLNSRIIVSFDALAASRLIQPGSLARYHYRVAVANASDEKLAAIAAEAAARFPEAGWEARTRSNASPQLAANIDRFAQFLALVGLTALVVGGVGVANAARAHIDARRESIAALKAIGATGGFVVLVYTLQTLMIAGLGIVIGLALGVALPFAAVSAFAHLLPVPIPIGIHAEILAVAAAYGVLVALAFALWPLGRAHDIPVQALYRERVEGARAWPRAGYIALILGVVAALLALATLLAADRNVALIFAAAALGAFIVLRLVAIALMAFAARLPRPKCTGLRLALANIHRPGALTPTVVLSLGLGLTLLVALATIDGNLRRQLAETLPERAPSFYFLDIPSTELADFSALLKREAPDARIDTVPMLRGRIVSIKGIPAETYPAPPRAAQLMRGDRGITYAERPPGNSTIVDGAWWPENYDGPPLVSFEARLARDLDLKVGDEIVVNVLGRNVAVRVANTRGVRWETLGINFFMVFSPNTFRGAPHTHLATLIYPDGGTVAREVAVVRAVADAFPGIVSVRVKEALEAASAVLAQLSTAVRAASSVTVLSAVLVLGGALAAGHRGRIYDAVILKTLGATRARLVAAYALEYLILGLATALFGLTVGTIAAYFVLTRVMDIGFTAMPEVGIAAVLGALAVTLAFGLFGTWRALREKPSPILRSI